MSALLSDNGLVAAQDLYYMLAGNEPIKLLDATYSAPMGLSPYQAFLSEHIEGAQFFDIDAVADQDSPLPHTLPSAEYFAASISALGISNADHVVIYDQSGAYMASSRAWWMFRAFGHQKVYVLEGGLADWKRQGFKIENGPVDSPDAAQFAATPNPELIVSMEDLQQNLETQEIMVLDARPAGRFNGSMPEPRPGMRAGHIPGSLNLPFVDLLDTRDGTFKPDFQIENILSALSVHEGAKIAVSCGSGVTACTVALALYKARRQDVAIYDGSWSEWGQMAADTPIATGA